MKHARPTLPPRYNGKHPGGRPTILTEELAGLLAEAIGKGMPDQEAADLAMIQRCTLDKWRNEDTQFSYKLKAARALKMSKRISRIDDGEASWQSSAWLLERTCPQHFARPELQVSMSVQHSGEIEHTVQMVAESELQRMSLLSREIDAEIIE